MANYTPPIDGNEMVMVHLVRSWGSQGLTPFRVYRLTRAALEALDTMFIQEAPIHEHWMPQVMGDNAANPPTIGGGETAIPEGGYVFRLAVETPDFQTVTLTWRPEGVELDGKALFRKMDTPNVGMISAVAADAYGHHQSLNMGAQGYMWLTPIRHLASLLRENPINTNLLRPPLKAASHHTEWAYSRVATLSVDPSKADPALIDNQFADGTALEDWLMFDCDAVSLIKAAS